MVFTLSKITGALLPLALIVVGGNITGDFGPLYENAAWHLFGIVAVIAFVCCCKAAWRRSALASFCVSYVWSTAACYMSLLCLIAYALP